jgi:hypothetical protein
MSLRSSTEDGLIRLPAWIAGIQIRKDASETSRQLDSALHAGMTQSKDLLELAEASAPYFQG